MGALRIALNILLCKLRDEFREVIKENAALITVISTAAAAIPPHLPIL